MRIGARDLFCRDGTYRRVNRVQSPFRCQPFDPRTIGQLSEVDYQLLRKSVVYRGIIAGLLPDEGTQALLDKLWIGCKWEGRKPDAYN